METSRRGHKTTLKDDGMSQYLRRVIRLRSTMLNCLRAHDDRKDDDIDERTKTEAAKRHDGWCQFDLLFFFNSEDEDQDVR